MAVKFPDDILLVSDCSLPCRLNTVSVRDDECIDASPEWKTPSGTIPKSSSLTDNIVSGVGVCVSVLSNCDLKKTSSYKLLRNSEKDKN